MSESNENFRSGVITLLGRPNTGKTTLVNALVGEKIGIVTPKPQTTKHRFMGVLTEPDCQMLFVDCPGVSEVKSNLALDKRVREHAESTVEEGDICLMMFDISRKHGVEDDIVIDLARSAKKIFIVLNKTDLNRNGSLENRKSILAEKITDFSSHPLFEISASNKSGLSSLKKALHQALPVGPRYFDDDTLTDQTLRVMAAELIREQIMLLTEEEVPYGCAVEIQAFKEDANQVRITAHIIVERESLKGMLIGKRGAMIKDLGIAARQEISKILGKTVHLELFVKVHKNWRKDPKAVKRYGYE